MNINFLEKESQIYDFINFPKILYVDYYKEEKFDQYRKSEIVLNNQLNRNRKIKDIQEEIEPYRDRIDKFYLLGNKESLVIGLPDLILGNKEKYSFKSKDEFYNTIENIDIFNTRIRILKRLSDIYDLNDKYNEEKIINMIKENSYIEYVENIDMDGEDKWKILILLNNTYDMGIEYIQLLQEIEDIFNNIYKDYEEEIDIEGNRILKTIEKEGLKSISKLSDGIIESDILERYSIKNIDISISLVDSNKLMMYAGEDEDKNFSKDELDNIENFHIDMGIWTNDLLKDSKILKEDELNERIEVFRILGDRTRYDTLKCLMDGINSTKDIAKITGVSSATISYHINSLISAKIIKFSNKGEFNKYRINKDLIDKTFEKFKESMYKE